MAGHRDRFQFPVGLVGYFEGYGVRGVGGGVFLSFCQVGFGCFLVAGGVVGGLGFEHGED